MAEMGASTSIAAPALIVMSRIMPSRSRLRRLRLSLPPAWASLVIFLVVHSAITAYMAFHQPSFSSHLILHVILLLGGLLFWMPVLGRKGLDGPAKSVYLFIAAPSLDLVAVYVISRGDIVGGLAMIVAMLPIGVSAVVLTWKWISSEERAQRILETTG